LLSEYPGKPGASSFLQAALVCYNAIVNYVYAHMRTCPERMDTDVQSDEKPVLFVTRL
jgi:hypothetical protein